MKQKFLIIALLTFALLGAYALKANAQTSVNAFDPALYKKPLPIAKVESTSAELLADETAITETKTGAKIECSNDKVHFKLYEKWQHTFIRYAWSWKKDRHGTYKHYVITVSKKDAELIKVWAKTYL